MPGVPRPIVRIKVRNPRTHAVTIKEFYTDDPLADNIHSRTDFEITKSHPEYDWLLRLKYINTDYWGGEFSRLVWDVKAGAEVWKKVIFLVAEDGGEEEILRFTHVMFGRDSWELSDSER